MRIGDSGMRIEIKVDSSQAIERLRKLHSEIKRVEKSVRIDKPKDGGS